MAVQPRSARHGCVRRKSLIASIAVVIPCLLLYALSFESQLMSDKQRSGRVVRPEESSPEVATTVSYILEVLKWNITRDESDTATLPSFAAGTCFRADEANSMQRCLPSFIIIGTQKSGTTELASWLQANPGLLRVRQHESHFFDCLPSSRWNDRGLCDTKHYASMKPYKAMMTYIHMSPKQPTAVRKMVFEKTPAYFDLADPKVVAGTLRGLKAVVILRDPTDRFYSSYWHSCRAKKRATGGQHVCSRQEFNQLVRDLGKQVASQGGCLRWKPEPKTIVHRLFDVGRYTVHLSNWHAHIPHSRIFVLFREHFMRDPFAVMADLERWLGVEAFEYRTVAKRKKAKGVWRVGKEIFKVHDYDDISANTRAAVDALYRDCNARLCQEFVALRRTELPTWLRTTCART